MTDLISYVQRKLDVVRFLVSKPMYEIEQAKETLASPISMSVY